MILRTCQLFKITVLEELRIASWAIGANHISKRYAGHSQYANRKQAKEASNQRKSELIKKYQLQIHRVIRNTKNANLATNSRLQSIFSEAMKNSVPKVSLENALRVAASTLSRDFINKFVFTGPYGITVLIEVSSINREAARAAAGGVTKKFGFQFVSGAEVSIGSVGIIICKPLENVENPLDKAMEDALLANCQDVTQSDNYIEFECNESELVTCAKKLTDIGYVVENSETRYIFPELVKITEEVILEKLEKMEEKLQLVPGFVRISYNLNK